MTAYQDVFSLEGLEEGSILYISIQVSDDHPMRDAVLTTDPAPDYDLHRLVRLLGEGSRRYFSRKVFDGTKMEFPSDLSPYRGVIIGCSVHSVNPVDGALQQWQKKLIEFVRYAVLECHIPYLGICGGAQIGLAAFDGQVGSNPVGVGFTPEIERSFLIRETEISLTNEGRCDPLLEGCSDSFGMTAIHSDYMKHAPEDKGFKTLANSSDIGNQIVAYGDKVRLIGLHPEVTREFLDDTVDPLLAAGAFSNIPREEVMSAFDGINPDLTSNRKIVLNFLKNFCTNTSV